MAKGELVSYPVGDTQRGWIRLFSNNPDLDIYGPMDESSPKLTGGWGGWEVTERPRQVGMTTWKGVEPFVLEFGIYLDRGLLEGVKRFNHPSRYSVEPALRELVKAARGDGDSRPAIVQVFGIPSLPVKRWVIENMEFGDAIRRPDVHRTRQQIKFTLREYVPPTFKRIHKRALKPNLGKVATVKVKKGDTPARIARRRGCDWKDLRTLNPGVVHKAAQNLKDGIKIRVPAQERRDRNRRNR